MRPPLPNPPLSTPPWRPAPHLVVRPTTDSPASCCIEDAAVFVAAQPGGADRLRAGHHRRADGYCARCGPRLVRWPCVQVVVADLSEQLPAPTGRPPARRVDLHERP